jgi:hypothetical protein
MRINGSSVSVMSETGEIAPEFERIPMQYLILDAAQYPTVYHREKYSGTHVGCWIKNQTKKNAYLIARGWVEERGWVVLSLEDQHPVTADNFTNNPEGRRYFEQALIDDEVFVFITHQD